MAPALAGASSMPVVYAPTSSSSRNHSGVRSAPPAGMPLTTTRPPAFVVRSAMSSARFDPVHSNTTSTPPSRNSWPRSGVSFTACPARRTALSACSGRTTSSAPAIVAAARCAACLAATITRPGCANRRSATCVRTPRCPRRSRARRRPRRHGLGTPNGSRVASGSISTAVRSSIPSGTGPELRAMREHHAAPSAAGARAVPGLQAWLQRADRDAVASAVLAGGAVLAELGLIPRGAAEHATRASPAGRPR